MWRFSIALLLVSSISLIAPELIFTWNTCRLASYAWVEKVCTCNSATDYSFNASTTFAPGWSCKVTTRKNKAGNKVKLSTASTSRLEMADKAPKTLKTSISKAFNFQIPTAMLYKVYAHWYNYQLLDASWWQWLMCRVTLLETLSFFRTSPQPLLCINRQVGFPRGPSVTISARRESLKSTCRHTSVQLTFWSTLKRGQSQMVWLLASGNFTSCSCLVGYTIMWISFLDRFHILKETVCQSVMFTQLSWMQSIRKNMLGDQSLHLNLVLELLR